MGKNMLNAYVWTFTTGLSMAPEVISTDPANAATGVPDDKVITVTFSEAMNSQGFNGTTFLLKEGNNSVTGVVSLNGSTASFAPSADLLSGVTYTATIRSQVREELPMGSSAISRFLLLSVPSPSGADCRRPRHEAQGSAPGSEHALQHRDALLQNAHGEVFPAEVATHKGHKLTIGDVRNVLRGQNTDSSAGDLALTTRISLLSTRISPMSSDR